MKPDLYAQSVVERDGATYALAFFDGRKVLHIRGIAGGFEGSLMREGDTGLFPMSEVNAARLRERLAWLQPQPLGLRASMGFGDRLGLATPGHVQAARRTGIGAVFAQQSVRENRRTGRTPQQVLDDAMWGVFQAGWRDPWGADADHLKTAEDVEAFAAAGYTFFTVDPGDHVDHTAQFDAASTLERKARALPWNRLGDSLEGLRGRYLGRAFTLDGLSLAFTEETLLRAAAKYGRAVVCAAELYGEVARKKRGVSFEFEVSVDETATPTSLAEHVYLALELKRLEVRVTSVAPRFAGRFEKGVDFIGELDELASHLAQHACLARGLGHKLSLHSGSDKFSVYPLFASHTGGLAHVKTAGSSYLEALRVVAAVRPALFRDILALARQRYPADRATYHVSAEVERVPVPVFSADAQLPALLDDFHARQVLHVTFGSVLAEYGETLKATLRAHEKQHYAVLENHFARHLAPFAVNAP